MLGTTAREELLLPVPAKCPADDDEDGSHEREAKPNGEYHNDCLRTGKEPQDGKSHSSQYQIEQADLSGVALKYITNICS
jgi:hypothetical protein